MLISAQSLSCVCVFFLWMFCIFCIFWVLISAQSLTCVCVFNEFCVFYSLLTWIWWKITLTRALVMSNAFLFFWLVLMHISSCFSTLTSYLIPMCLSTQKLNFFLCLVFFTFSKPTNKVQLLQFQELLIVDSVKK